MTKNRGDFDQSCTEIETKRKMLNDHLNRVDTDLSIFKNYCDDMKHDTVMRLFEANYLDIISDNAQQFNNDVKNYTKLLEEEEAHKDVLSFEIDEEDLPPEDTKIEFGDHTRPMIPSKMPSKRENPKTKARMVSFQQIYDLINLCLNKSFMRKRVRSSEQDIHVLQQKVHTLEEWRVEMEEKTTGKFNEIDTLFSSGDSRNYKQIRDIKEEHSNIYDKLKGLDLLLRNTRAEMDDHKHVTEGQGNHIVELEAKVDMNWQNIS